MHLRRVIQLMFGFSPSPTKGWILIILIILNIKALAWSCFTVFIFDRGHPDGRQEQVGASGWEHNQLFRKLHKTPFHCTYTPLHRAFSHCTTFQLQHGLGAMVDAQQQQPSSPQEMPPNQLHLHPQRWGVRNLPQIIQYNWSPVDTWTGHLSFLLISSQD